MLRLYFKQAIEQLKQDRLFSGLYNGYMDNTFLGAFHDNFNAQLFNNYHYCADRHLFACTNFEQHQSNRRFA